MALDKSTYGLTMTAAGTASATSTASYKFGGSAMSFPGLANSYIRSAGITSPYIIGLRDFTIEYWFYHTGYDTGASSPWSTIVQMGGTGTTYANSRLWIYHQSTSGVGTSTTQLNFHIHTGAASFTSPTFPVTVSIPNSTWHHVAWVRKNGQMYAYLDGVQVGSIAANTSIGLTAGQFIQLGANMVTGFEFPMKGYIDDFRITLDVARYPVNIAPSTEPTLSGDSLAANVVMGCAFNGPSGSTSTTDITGKTVVFGGDASLSSTQSRSGSVSLATGTTGYVDVGSPSDFAFGTQNFTMEAWIYLISLPSTPNTAPIMTTLTSGNIGWRFVISNVGGTYSFGLQPGVGGGANVTFVTPPRVNTWYHVAATRIGDVIQLFWNGAFMGSATLTAGLSFQQGNTLRIGRDPVSATQRLNGYIEDARITVGAARYVDTGQTSFSVPASAWPIGFANYPVIFTTSGGQSSRAGQAVAIQFTATSQASPLVYTKSSGTLPPGLTLSSTGLLSGTIPSGTTPQAYNFTIRAAAGLSSGELAVTYSVVASGNEYVITLVHADDASGTSVADATGRQTYVFNSQSSLSTTVSKFGGKSMAFNGVVTGPGTTAIPSMIESTANPTDFAFGTNDWTFECWAYFNPASGNGYPPLLAVCDKSLNSLQGTMGFGTRISGGQVISVFLNAFNDSARNVSAGTSLALGTWHHFAWTRQGTTLRQFINGTIQGQTTLAAGASYNPTSSSVLMIGGAFTQTNNGSPNGSYCLNGNIDEVRIANGVALYTANFTPPTAPFNYP